MVNGWVQAFFNVGGWTKGMGGLLVIIHDSMVVHG